MIGRRGLLLGAGAGLLAAGLGGWAHTRDAFEGAAIDAEAAHSAAASGEVTLVDVRRPEEWAKTGVPEGAHAIDMRRDDFLEAIEEAVGGDRSAPVALICAGGVRSGRVASRLEAAGFTRVANVEEGMMGSSAGPGWLDRGLPVTRP